MSSIDPLHDHAAELIEAARTFHAAAGEPGRHNAAPLALARTEEALQLLSSSWYLLAAEAAPSRGDGRSPFHDVAAAFARCARVCRDARSAIAPDREGLAERAAA